MADSMGFSFKITSKIAKQTVVIDDDGRVAYAYLLDVDDQLCGDVWLYNRCVAPIDPEWRDRGMAPFANPKEYVRDVEFVPPVSGDEFSVRWDNTNDGYVATVLLRGNIFATLKEGVKPGWAVLAKKDGPLAKVLGV